MSNNLINLNDKFWLVSIVNIANEFPYLGTNKMRQLLIPFEEYITLNLINLQDAKEMYSQIIFLLTLLVIKLLVKKITLVGIICGNKKKLPNL